MKCPVCGDEHPHLVTNFNTVTDWLLLAELKSEAPAWHPSQGACTRCLDGAQADCYLRVQEQWRAEDMAGAVDGYQILPAPIRLHADPDLSGRGVTICMIDSGFYPHPDLVFPDNRILAMVDITHPERDESYFMESRDNAWHGTMTSVVCAGNGYLSHGKYRSLAPNARVVLLKVSDNEGRITGANITRALEWVLENRQQYNIRIVNLSVTDDEAESWKTNRVSQAVQRAVEAGICVVAAAGNDPDAALLPPASAPHAITVGGLNDRNTLHPLAHALYHSTYGLTTDRFQKPDLIAPAIWLAAPILPGSAAYQEAVILFDLWETPDMYLSAKLANLLSLTSLEPGLVMLPPAEIREAIRQYVARNKWISPHYQHADGTSFAAPIVCSLIAQLLEANPALDPQQVREILLSTARPLAGASTERQGFGVVHPPGAAAVARGKDLPASTGFTPAINYRDGFVTFFFHEKDVEEVLATGDFNGWSDKSLVLQEQGSGWTGKMPLPPTGTYRYKFLVDRQIWKTDPANLFREPDGIDGFNNQLIIE